MASNGENLTKRRRVATARTSGSSVALLANLKRLREKGMSKSEIEEKQIRMRASRVKRKIFEKIGVEYCSDEEEMKKRCAQETDLSEFLKSESEDDDYLVDKQAPLSSAADKIKAEEEENFEEDEEEIAMDDLFVEKAECSEETTVKSESSIEVDQEEEVPSTSNQTIDTNDQVKNTITRCTLYPVLDPRNNNANAILKCSFCMERGEMRLYSSEDTLLDHMVMKHQDDIG